ncbi:MAG: glutamate formimidoyltransferase [Planctomycetota bacterium]
MSEQLIECVPNFSEGRDPNIIKQITEVVETVEGVRLLDVDPGKATNRTVVTFVGPPEAVCETAFRLAKKVAELIDMSKHTGEHPRFGALDVCPLVPVANITMDETAAYARKLAKRLGDELGMTIYCYEYAATSPQRKNLADVRAGEYEGLAAKLAKPEWTPDFGPAKFSVRSGATAVGARDFLVAYNVNLNTTSTRRANAIAFDIREKGRPRTMEGTPNGKPVLDDHGNQVWEPGSLKAVKAIGWYIEEYGVAQISINLTNLSATPLHVAFDECCKKANARGIRVTGSELVGLVPLSSMLDAGRYFLKKQQRSFGVSDKELIKIAVKSLGLHDLYPFKPEEKIIEYAIAAPRQCRDREGAGVASPLAGGANQSVERQRHELVFCKPARLVQMTVADFVEETASESPAPGGGSVAAAVGAMGAALATMVANLSSHKRGWEDRWEAFSDWAEKGKQHYVELLRLIDEDTAAFSAVMTAYGLPKSTDAEKAERHRAIQDATKRAIEVPLRVMEVSLASMEVIKAMAEIGNPNSVSDAGVAALCARTAVLGAYLNVKINAGNLEDKSFVASAVRFADSVRDNAVTKECEILGIVDHKL